MIAGPYQYIASLTMPTAALLSVFGGTFGHEAVLAVCGYLPMPEVNCYLKLVTLLEEKGR